MPDSVTAFRSINSTAASVKVTKVTDLGGGAQSWSASVLNGTVLGAAVPFAFAGTTFPANGVGAVGAKLLDLEVLAVGPWTAAGSDWTSPATSQRV